MPMPSEAHSQRPRHPAMTGGGRQRRKNRRQRKARQAAAAAAGTTTHISSLTDDIVLQIFLRLPSLATLVRAASACRAWRRAVASSPAFHRRFRALHPAASLLGVFADSHGDLPSFAAAHRRADQDSLAALRGGDFVLASLMDQADAHLPLTWLTADCRDGYLLLSNSNTYLFAAVNPMSRHRPDYIDGPTLDSDTGADADAAEHRGRAVAVDVHLLSSDEDPMSFRLVQLFHDEPRTKVCAAVFSSETWDWRVLPWAEVAVPHEFGDEEWLELGSQASGLVCWKFRRQESMLTLDTKTMELAVWDLPPCPVPVGDDWFCVLHRTLLVGETMDGALSMVRVTLPGVYVWTRGGDDDKWALDDCLLYTDQAALLRNIVGLPDLKPAITDLMAMKDGFVYLATSEMVLSLSLETWKLEKLLPWSFVFRRRCCCPYFMAWPSSLVGDYGRFAVLHQAQDDPTHSSNGAVTA